MYARRAMHLHQRPLLALPLDSSPHLVKIMLETARSAAYHGAQLGLDPASAKRIYPHRRPGRPVGAGAGS